jgi:hypothetical protein
MELKSKESKFKFEPKGPGSMEKTMFYFGIFSMFSAIIWTFTGIGDEEPDVWTWFSRFALGVICLGFAGVIREIRKLREKDD